MYYLMKEWKINKMNQKGEYVKKTMCPFCKYKLIMDKYGSPGCIDMDKDKCTRFEKDILQSIDSRKSEVKT